MPTRYTPILNDSWTLSWRCPTAIQSRCLAAAQIVAPIAPPQPHYEVWHTTLCWSTWCRTTTLYVIWLNSWYAYKLSLSVHMHFRVVGLLEMNLPLYGNHKNICLYTNKVEFKLSLCEINNSSVTISAYNSMHKDFPRGRRVSYFIGIAVYSIYTLILLKTLLFEPELVWWLPSWVPVIKRREKVWHMLIAIRWCRRECDKSYIGRVSSYSNYLKICLPMLVGRSVDPKVENYLPKVFQS